MKRILASVLFMLLVSCTAIRTRVRWASVGDTPLICCGGVGNWVDVPVAPSYGQAELAYIQIVNLPGGCGSFVRGTKAGDLAYAIERELDSWSACPNGCRVQNGNVERFGNSAQLGKMLTGLKDATIRQGPNMHSSHGPPCFASTARTATLSPPSTPFVTPTITPSAAKCRYSNIQCMADAERALPGDGMAVWVAVADDDRIGSDPVCALSQTRFGDAGRVRMVTASGGVTELTSAGSWMKVTDAGIYDVWRDGTFRILLRQHRP